MNVKNVIAIFIISILFLFVSCDGSSSSTSSSSYTKNESSRSIDSDSYDSISYETFSTSVTLDLSTPSIDSEEITTSGVELSSGITAKLAKSSKPAYLTVDTSGYDGNVELNISGTLSNYGLKIDGNASYCVTLNLSDVTIESANTPCIKVSDITKSYIVFDGTNTLTDGRSYGTGYSKAEGTDYYTSSYDGDIEDGAEETQTWALGDDAKGTIFSKFPLIFSGDGTLSVTQNYKHAIYSKDYIKVNSGTINTASTGGRNGFQSVNGFIMNGGKITINGSGTNIDNESRGIVVEGSDENSSYAGEGYILINDGTLTINTYSKGITAKWDIDEDYTTSSTSDDPYPAVLINGGTITVTTTGTVKDDYSASVTDANGVTSTETVSCSPEGIEGKQAIYITGGTITVNSTDDALNVSRDSSGVLNISDGYVYAKSTSEDSIDSNGTVTISGGVVYAYTTASGSGAFDCDGTILVTGGTLFGLNKSSNLASYPSSSSTQGVCVLSGSYLGSSSGSKFALVNSSSSEVAYALELPTSLSSSYTAIISSSGISSGNSYKAYKNVTASGGSEFEGLYYEMPTVSGGSTTGTISMSSNYYSNASSTSSGPSFH